MNSKLSEKLQEIGKKKTDLVCSICSLIHHWCTDFTTSVCQKKLHFKDLALNIYSQPNSCIKAKS